jgi:hypothetical protein
VLNKLSFRRKDLLIYLLLTLAGISAIIAVSQFSKPPLTIRWTTESEIDVLGFNLLRSDEPDGQYVKVNSAIIRPAQDPFIGGEYTYKDGDVSRGVTYYYRLETIYRDGRTEQSDPIVVKAGG